MPVTEVVCMVTKPGTNPIDESSHEGQVLATAWKTVTQHPNGPYRAYYGTEVEDPSKLWCFFDFESVEDHQNFVKRYCGLFGDFLSAETEGWNHDRSGAEAVKELPNILAGSEFGGKHLDLKPYPPTALQAPVTEILLAYFDPVSNQTIKDVATSKLSQFADNALYKCSDVRGVSVGWGIENDFPVRGGSGNGQKGSVLVALIGWPSVEAHMKFRESEDFKQNIHLLGGWEGNLSMTMFHVKTRVLINAARQG